MDSVKCFRRTRADSPSERGELASVRQETMSFSTWHTWPICWLTPTRTSWSSFSAMTTTKSYSLRSRQKECRFTCGTTGSKTSSRLQSKRKSPSHMPPFPTACLYLTTTYRLLTKTQRSQPLWRRRHGGQLDVSSSTFWAGRGSDIEVFVTQTRINWHKPKLIIFKHDLSLIS